MTTERENLLDKIRALLAKTIENGCTEAEALAALAKAQAMMDAYDVTEADLALTKEEKAILRKEPAGMRDPHDVKSYLASAVAEFASCKVWRQREGGLVFCGLPSDTHMATWLLDMLAGFVLRELTNHLCHTIVPPRERRPVINGFVSGCTRRINERLRELRAASQTQASGHGRALIVVKTDLIKATMRAHGITLRSRSRSARQYDAGSYAAGMTAGDRATFGRPVSHSSGPRLIGRG